MIVEKIGETKTPSPASELDRNILTAAKGSGIVMAGRLVRVSLRFITAVLMARLLGATQFGLYNLGLTAAELSASLASLGLGTALVRFVPFFNSRRDGPGLRGALQICLGMPTLASVLLAIGLYALADPIAVRIFHETKLAPVLRLVCPLIPFLALNDMIAAATRGFKKMHYTVIAQHISHPLIKLVLMIGLAIVGLNAARAVMASSLAEVVTSGLLLYFFNKLFPLRRLLQRAARGTKRIVRYSLPVYLSTLIEIFSRQIQTILLGTFSTVANIGIYTLTRQVNMLGEIFHFSIVSAAQPIISELHSRNEKSELEHFYQTMNKWTFTLNFPTFLIVLLFPGPILSMFGKSFAGGVIVLEILAWRSLVDTGTGICGSMLDMTGNTDLKLINNITITVLTLGLNILFIPRWGLFGAAIASLIAVAVINVLRIVEVYFLLRMFPYNSSFVKPVVAGLTAFAATLVTGRLLPPEAGLVCAVAGITVLLAVYAGMILLLGISIEDRIIVGHLSRRVRTMLSRG